MTTPARMILVTNDDGIHSEGILALKTALASIGKVVIVAPDRPRSASGHSITLHKPLRAEQVRLSDGDFGYSSNGTPSDCISLGVRDLADGPVDLVVSGINKGPNLGWDVLYSGTVSAAIEGAMAGIPSFAISVASNAIDVTYDYAAQFAAHLAEIILSHKLQEHMLLNVNIPFVEEASIAGVEVTRQGKRHYEGKIEKRTDPMGRTYYWLGGDLPLDELDEGTDVKAVADKKVSITPLHLDLTAYQNMDEIRAWPVDKFVFNRK